METQRVLRIDLVVALEKRRFVAWLRSADQGHALATGRHAEDCPLRAYLWESLGAARHHVRAVFVFYDHVEVYTDTEYARLVVPAWARRLMHRLASDDRVDPSRVLTSDVRRLLGV